MFKYQILKYYSQQPILDALMVISENRELVGTFENGAYSKRPNIVSYPQDIVEMVKDGVVSFHASVERWSNVMSLEPRIYDSLRIGWDFVCDVDSNLGIEEAKVATKLIIECLEKYGVKNPSLKFSGRRGFHVGLRFESFPKEVNYKKTEKLYPRIPQIIASFIREEIREELLEKLVEMKGSVKELFEGLDKVERLDPYYFVEIEKNWGVRHLYRCPYSLHNKTWLVSMPLRLKDLDKFQPEQASPEKVNFKEKFLEDYLENEAADLLTEAMDWWSSQKKETIKPKRKIKFQRRVDARFFPPCIKLIMKGMEDGMHRSTFTLISYLKLMNWKWEEIEKALIEWNRKNNPPLPNTYLSSQLKWHARQLREILPANCDNDQFFGSIGICNPDGICKKIKNPASYPFRKLGLTKYRGKKKGRKK